MNIDIFLPDGPFHVYFPQKLPKEEFDNILTGSRMFESKQQYYPRQDRSLVMEIDHLLKFDIRQNKNFFEVPFGNKEEQVAGKVPSASF
mmetsp:Transcript_37254/g.57148  ORF Transcript_37254/g.57148 Transcript_37254/m.57148 type:complete len:89 (+) Transcript_37254:881-1147(+)